MKIKFIKINRKTKEMVNILASSFIFISLIFAPFSPLINKSEAVFNKQINYQGKLTTSAGVAVANGTYNMEFILYSVSTGGSSLWTETRTGVDKVQVTNGLFSVLLGEVNALTGVDFNQTLYLGVNIGGTGTPGWDGEMAPRKKLGAVPAAVVSENANITNDATTSSAVYPTWVTTNSGGMPIKTSSAQLSFIPSTGALTVSGYVYTPTIDTSSATALNIGTTTQNALTLGRVGANTTINGAVVAINSNAASALNITSGTTGALTLDSGTTGTINIGTGTGGKTINIGTNNTTADTILIGSALDTIKISKFAVNGFLKTNSSDGTLSVDTNTYLTSASLSSYVPYTGATGNVTLGTYSLTTPNVIGGTTTTSPLTFQTTTGVGTTGADMHFKVGNNGATEAMTILNSGNVGIGVTSPSSKLHIYGTQMVGDGAQTSFLAGATLQIQKQNGNATSLGFWQNGVASTLIGHKANDSNFYLTNNYSGPGLGTLAYSASISLMGNFGIGRSSATSNFQVAQDTAGVGTVTTNGTTTLTGSSTQFLNTFKVGDTITVSGETVRTIATIASNTSLTVTVAFSTSASSLSYTLVGGDRFSVLGNGNVGIGTVVPGSRLQISTGNSSFTPSTSAFSIRKNEEGYGLFAGVDASGTSWIQSGTASDNTNYNLVLQSRGGNVGVGTTSPGAKLDIGGSTSVTGGVTMATGITVDTDSIQSLQLQNKNTGINSEMRFMAAGSDGSYMAFTQPGINNTSTGFFGVPKNLGSFLFNYAGAGTARDMYIGSLDAKSVNLATSNTVRLTVSSTGNLGIGTTNPTYKLDVNGTANIGSTLTLTTAPTTSAGGYDIMTRNTSTGAIEKVSSSLFGGVLSGTVNYVSKFTGTGSTIGNSLIFDNGTNVGIGTTAPNGKLEVFGNPAAGTTVGDFVVDTAAKTVYIGRLSSTSGDNTNFIFRNRLGVTKFRVDPAASGIHLWDPEAADIQLQPTGTGGVSIGAVSAGTSKLYVNGNVGIGTTSPTGKLDISAGLGTQTAGDFVVDTASNIVYVGKLDSNSGNTNLIFRDRLGNVKSRWENAGSGSIGYGNFSDGYGVKIQRGAVSSAVGNIGSLFYVDSTGSVNPTAIFMGGNVGVGTTAPGYALDIGGSGVLNVGGSMIRFGGVKIIGTTGNNVQINSKASGSDVEIVNYNTGIANVTFKDGGSVGVGTTAPTYKLDVAGTASTDAIRTRIGLDFYQVPTPSSLSGIVSAGGSVDTGDHIYYVTYTTAIGMTQSFASSTITTTAGNNTVTLTIPVSSDSRVTGRKIYRTKAGGSTANEYLLATIANNTATTYVDTVADSTLTGSIGIAYYAPNTTNNQMTINGTKAMLIDSNGTYLGIQAGYSNFGARNTFLGYTAGFSNTNSSYSTLVGHGAGYTQTGGLNTVVGSYALYNTAGGSVNDAFGFQSLSGNIGGSNNQAFGSSAGRYITGGSVANTTPNQSIFIGANTKALADSQTNQIVIGYNAIGIGSNSVVLGNDSILTTALKGNVGIGTTNPGYKLDVNGTANIGNTLTLTTAPTTSAGGYDIMTRNTSTGAIEKVSSSSFGSALSGTLNKIAKFTGTGTTIGDSLIFDNGTNVGIGTTAPGAKLHIRGGNAQMLLRLNYSSTDVEAGYYGAIGHRGDTGGGFTLDSVSQGNSGSAGFVFRRSIDSGSNYTESMRIDKSGNVGIGTTSPTSIFALNGTAARTIQMERNTTAATAGQGLTLSSGGAIAGTADLNGGDLTFKSGISTGTGSSAMHFFTTTAGTTAVTDRTPTEKMTILGSGNVGIGTTSPAGKLHIVGTGDLSLRAENASYKLDFGVDSNSSFFQSRTSTNTAAPLYLYTGSTIGLALNTSGNVGIGTTNPGYKLDVNGTANIGNTLTLTTAPTTSAGGYDIMTRNTSTGAIEKVLSSSFLTSGGAVTSFSAGTTGLTPSTATTGAITLGGTLVVGNGGTGVSTFATNGVLYGNGAGAIGVTAQGGANTVLVANAGTPSFSAAINVGTSVSSPVFQGIAAATTLGNASYNTAITSNVWGITGAGVASGLTGLTSTGNVTLTGANITGGSPLVFDGTTADAFKTTFVITDPTTPSKTITFPNATGTVALTSDIPSLSGYLLATGATTGATSQSQTFTNGITLNATSIVTDTTTGLKIGTGATQKLGFFNATPVVGQSGDIVTALSNLGLVTSGTVASATTAGSVVNSVTFNNGGSGAVSGTTFNGSAAQTISYNTIGAQASNSSLTSIAGLTYASPAFVKMTGANTFTLDTNTYLTTSSGVSSLTGTTNQISASASTGAVTLSIPSDFRAPGTLNAVTSIATGAGAGTVRIDASGNLTNIGTISSGAITSGLINGQTISSTANFTGTLNVDTDTLSVDGSNHRVYIGATSEGTSSSKLYVTGSTAANGSSSAIAGILGGYTFNPTAGGVQVGNRFVVTNSPTTNANTVVAELIRVVDNTSLSNTVRGLDITANGGSNTAGTNTGLRAAGATFGVQGVISGLGGGVAVPAALYGESTGTTQGDILRLYSQSVTSATSYANFYHNTSTFTGTGLLMKFATGSGSFTGNFIDLQKNNVSLFKVTNAGVTSLGLSGTASTTAVCSSLANGTSPTAGVAYELRDCSGAPVADYAEMYPVKSGIEYGDIVSTGTEMVSTYDVGADGNIDWNKIKGNVTRLVKSTDGYQQNVIGIVSDNKNDFSSTGYNIKDTDNPMPVALNGRVPVKISQSSSPIKAGDYLTTSQVDPGMAARALRSGFVIGKALEDWSPYSGKNLVMVYVEQGYYESDGAHQFVGESTFNGLTFFNANVDFAKSVKFEDVAEFVVPPLFNSDTAGFAVVKAGANKVDVTFDKSYIATPIVNTTISFEKVKNADGSTATFDAKTFFDNDIKSVIADKDEKGFSIVLNKVAPQDVRFSWIALAVKNPKVFESVISGLVIDPTPTNLAQQNDSSSTGSASSSSQTTTPLVDSLSTTSSTDSIVTDNTSTTDLSSSSQTASVAGSGTGIIDSLINAITGGSDTTNTTTTDTSSSGSTPTTTTTTTPVVETTTPAPVATDTSAPAPDPAI